MAYEFLRQMEMSSGVALVEIEAGTARIQSADNGVVTNLQTTDDGAEIDCLVKSLPFPTAEFKFDGVVPFDRKLNQEILRVTKLSAGKYTLNIGENPAGTEYHQVDASFDGRIPRHVSG